MNDPCARAVTWSGQEYPLSLNHPWTRAFLNHRGIYGDNGSSAAAVLGRFESGNYTPEDVERVLELGLIGAGKSRAEAAALINQHVYGKPLADNAKAAANVLVGLFIGETKIDDASA